jgi:hypothetical protein
MLLSFERPAFAAGDVRTHSAFARKSSEAGAISLSTVLENCTEAT